MNRFIVLKTFLASVLIATSSIFGGFDYPLRALVILLVADYITGLIAAFFTATLSSKIGLKGILKKIMYLIVIAVAVVIDNLVSAGGWVRNATIYFFICNEGISILENAGKCGLKYPKLLIEKLQQIQSKYTSGGEDDDQ